MTFAPSTTSFATPLTRALAPLALIGATLAGCAQGDGDADGDAGGDAAGEPATQQGATPTPDATESVSILRPDVAPPEIETEAEQPLGPYQAVVGFPKGGTKLDAKAVAALEGVMASEQFALGLPITLRAHSDSAGSDQINLDASEKRGLAVAEWLIDQGVEPDRITVIAFGEQNPLKPNALADGAPNPEGRAANRRVEIEVPSLPAKAGANGAQAADASKGEGAATRSVEVGD
ncbi:MAG: OmpA family protein [Erythrobacter sp.]|jgi:OOP family OmpA-OmpF porin|nr:OmpA family protein [Erythrobacter sp.]